MSGADVFAEFALWCNDLDAADPGETEWEVITRRSLDRLDPVKTRALMSHLKYLLSLDLDDAELRKIWTEAGAGIVFFPSFRWFFEWILEQPSEK